MSNPPPAGGPKVRKPNRLRGPAAPKPPAPRHAAFVPKLLAEILPAGTRDTLPEEAQDLFVQGYNYGLEEYGDPERALHLGWAAVHRHFHKVGDRWVAQAPKQDELPQPNQSDDKIVERLRQLHHR